MLAWRSLKLFLVHFFCMKNLIEGQFCSRSSKNVVYSTSKIVYHQEKNNNIENKTTSFNKQTKIKPTITSYDVMFCFITIAYLS